jgi:hypothetical protein
MKQIANVNCLSQYATTNVTPEQRHAHEETKKHTHFSVRFHDGCYLVRASSPAIVALLNCKIAATLTAARLQDDLQLDAYTLRSDLAKAFPPTSSTVSRSKKFQLNINIVGRQSKAKEISAILSDSGFYLQDPILQYDHVEYSNPHFLRFKDVSGQDLLLYKNSLEKSLGCEDELHSLDHILDNLHYHTGECDIKNDRLTVTLKRCANNSREMQGFVPKFTSQTSA